MALSSFVITTLTITTLTKGRPMARKTTLASRLEAASKKKAVALATFETAAVALEASADEHSAIAFEIGEEVARLNTLGLDAEKNADQAARAAVKVRDLVA